MAVSLHVWGERACFARPEFRLDRVSYDVPTPLAARGMLEAIHWKPAIRWHVEKIHVLRPINFERLGRAIDLVDVAYLIEAYFSLTEKAGAEDTAAKHISMFTRSARRRETFRPLCLGASRHPAQFALVEGGDLPRSTYPAEQERVDLGWMLYDLHHENPRMKRFFRAELVGGVLTVPASDSPDLAA